MSRRRTLVVALLAVSSATAQTRCSVKDEARRCAMQPVWRSTGWPVARTLAFGVNSHRVQAGVEVAWLLLCSIDHSPRAAAFEKLAAREHVHGVKPIPLPQITVARKPSADPEIAGLQRSYRKLVQLGLHAEAAQVASRIASPASDEDASPVVPALAVEGSTSTGVEQASFVRREAVAGTVPHKSVVSCRFQGETIEEAARYFEEALGVPVRVEKGERPMPRIYFSCENVQPGSALAQMAEGCGWTYVPGVPALLRPPALLPLRADRLPILR